MAAIRAKQSVSFRQSAATGARVSSRVTRVPAAATRSVVKCASEYKWYPGAKAPEYLDGSMAGDYGFDPLRLGSNSEYLPYFREAELMNGRYAMLVTACIMLTDVASMRLYSTGGAAGVATAAAVALIVAAAHGNTAPPRTQRVLPSLQDSPTTCHLPYTSQTNQPLPPRGCAR